MNNLFKSEVKQSTLVKDLSLGEHKKHLIKAGAIINTIKLENGDYKIFHYLGWFIIDKKYFEKEAV